MNSPQRNKKYWAEHNAARKAHPALDRAQIHIEVCGANKSSKDLTREEFDKVIARFQSFSQPANLQPQLRALNQPKTRFLHKIMVEQAAQLRAMNEWEEQGGQRPGLGPQPTPEQTILAICSDKFRGRKPQDLSERKRPNPADPTDPKPSELEMLMWTVARTISERRQKLGWTQHDLFTAAGQPCHCADCTRPTIVLPKPSKPRATAPQQPLQPAYTNPAF